MITMCFTTTHVSIRRGRTTRRYTPTASSFKRLWKIAYSSATRITPTNRSVTYQWHGLSTLDKTQRMAYNYYQLTAVALPLYKSQDNYHVACARVIGAYNTCVAIGIHRELLGALL